MCAATITAGVVAVGIITTAAVEKSAHVTTTMLETETMTVTRGEARGVCLKGAIPTQEVVAVIIKGVIIKEVKAEEMAGEEAEAEEEEEEEGFRQEVRYYYTAHFWHNSSIWCRLHLHN